MNLQWQDHVAIYLDAQGLQLDIPCFEFLLCHSLAMRSWEDKLNVSGL